MINRVIPLTGIHNLRDYGGYGALGGRRVKTGLLWRSGQHIDATPQDLAAFEALSVRTIIDLRGEMERERSPCARAPEFCASVLSVGGETTGHAPHMAAARDVRTAGEAFEALRANYAGMPFRPQLIQIFSLYFEALAEREGASLVHCLAGKDRTGLVVALLHHLLGVHPDDAMADYLLTNSAGNAETRIAAGAATVKRSFGAEMDDDAVRMLMSVQPEWLDTAFAAIRDQHDSVEAYARDLLGVTDERLTRIEANLLD